MKLILEIIYARIYFFNILNIWSIFEIWYALFSNIRNQRITYIGEFYNQEQIYMSYKMIQKQQFMDSLLKVLL